MSYVLRCTDCKYEDFDIKQEPCRTCLSSDTEVYCVFEPKIELIEDDDHE